MARRKTTTLTTEHPSTTITEVASSPGKHGRALVFISHDSRDAELAEAFANLLTDVSAGTLKSFRSSDKKGGSGLEFGTEWYKAIMSQLSDATDVVALLTHHSIDRPWILYEAGVAKGKLNTNVLGVALAVPLEKVSTGPFGQFQNCGDDEDSLTKLVIQLLQRNLDASPREEAVRVQVRVFIEQVKKLGSGKGQTQPSAHTDESGVAKLFEEVKIMVRELPERVDEKVRSVTRRGSSRKLRRIHPMMIEELTAHPAIRELPAGPAAMWIWLLSLFRDDLPWLPELGHYMYEALLSRNPKKVLEAAMRFSRSSRSLRGAQSFMKCSTQTTKRSTSSRGTSLNCWTVLRQSSQTKRRQQFGGGPSFVEQRSISHPKRANHSFQRTAFGSR